MNKKLLALIVAGGMSGSLQAELMLEETTIIGSADAVRTLPGSAARVDNAQISIEAANDINQLLKTVPGTYIREEDGYGLRPNIGIRGATSERSSKITLMEDGVLIAPAPYSNPEAYYFPTAMRMHTIEVLKGAPLLRYGPQTTGGVVNLVSTPIPEESEGRVSLRYGQNGEADMLANVGGRAGDFGVLLETAQRRSDGFKDIDRSSRDSGYEISDYLLKLGWEAERQSLLFKAQYSDEVSNETYLGLTDADFDRDADRRYGLSLPDEMNNDHEGYSLHYSFALTDNLQVSALGYHNRFVRDWFKLDGAGALIDAANAGDATAQGVLDGTVDTTGLRYKHNQRRYESSGVELNVDYSIGAHALALGGRLHHDEMDRFQPEEIFDQVNGELVFVAIDEPTGGDNRIEEADAISLWLTDDWSLTDALSLNLALRYEDVESERRQYATPGRIDAPSQRGNESSEWLPGASLTYHLNESWQLLAGVHRGFSPLGGGATANEDPEISTNWEAGVRYQGAVFVEAIAFYSDFENKTESCSNADPCSNGATSGSFNTGEAVIQGIEWQVGAQFEAAGLNIPVDLMYTWTDAEITSDNAISGVEDGDLLASVPEHTWSVRTGIETGFGASAYLVAKYTDEMCVNVGCNRDGGRYDYTEDLLVLDLIGRYQFNDNVVSYLKVENIADETAIVSRQPDGARPNKPRTVSVGVDWSF